MRSSAIAIATIALLLAAGCAGDSGQTSLPDARPDGGALRGWLSPYAKSGQSLIYVSIASNSSSEVAVFSQKGRHQQPVGEITQGVDGPIGLFVDQQRNLYVANFVNGTVTIYPPGSTSPSETLTGASHPRSIVVARDGTVYVADEKHLTNGTVLKYLKGHTTPSRTIVVFGSMTYPTGLALDSSNDLYVAYHHPCRRDPCGHEKLGDVLKFMHGSSTGVNLGIHVSDVGGIAIDRNDDLLVAVLGSGRHDAINVFPPGSTSPSKKIQLCAGNNVALNHANTKIWASATCGLGGYVFGVTYPAGRTVDTIAAHGWALGIATSPDGSE